MPWLDAYPANSFHLTSMHRLEIDDRWTGLPRVLGLTSHPRPTENFNVGTSKGHYAPLMRALYDRGLTVDPA